MDLMDQSNGSLQKDLCELQLFFIMGCRSMYRGMSVCVCAINLGIVLQMLFTLFCKTRISHWPGTQEASQAGGSASARTPSSVSTSSY